MSDWPPSRRRAAGGCGVAQQCSCLDLDIGAGHQECPSARATAARMRLGWQVVVTTPIVWTSLNPPAR
jgi:hypothetical protein